MGNQSITPTPTKRRLAHRLIVAIILFSSFITLITTGIQLFIDYKHDLDTIRKSIHTIRSTHLNTLSHSVWVFDEQRILIQLDGLLQMQDMEYLAILINGEQKWEAGEVTSKKTISQNIELTYLFDSQNYHLGTLKIVASVDAVYGRLLKKAVVILTSNFIKTFLVALFTLYIFRQWVTRHLESMAKYCQDIRFGRKNKALTLDRISQTDIDDDELGLVVASINQMQENLEHDHKKRNELEDKLQQAQKMEAIGTLAGGIAHDFNNILTPIIGYTQLVQENLPAKSKAKGQLVKVLKAADRAKELVQQILTFSHQTTDHEHRPLKVHLIVKEALKLLRASIPTSIEIKQTIAQDCKDVLADPTQIHQIIMNLCTNAYHAMREKGGILAVSLSEIEIAPADHPASLQWVAGTYIRLVVSDSGHGIPPEILPNIFTPYFTTKKLGEGTGMGLALVHGIIKSHRGNITVYSEPEKGTTFNVYLPCLEVAPTPIETQSPELSIGGNERILVVDDEEVIVTLQKQMLESLGYHVTTLTSSTDTFTTFQSHPHKYDLLITDMAMPDLTGIELARKIKAIKPDFPIILCTGFSELINGEKASTFGISGYLMKPVMKQDLNFTIREVLDTGKNTT
jgi:signal transduction histidine kinase/ActR/RegA family two-component response regulator